MADRVALYPGSFDPVTHGHLDVLQRALLMFDRVCVAVLANSTKQSLFSIDERVELIRQSVADEGSVDVITFEGLTVEAARQVGAVAIVRGLRATSDFESEFQMALMNRRLAPDVQTVFLMTSFANVYVSSSIIKEVSRLGGAIADLVPPASAEALKGKFATAETAGGST